MNSYNPSGDGIHKVRVTFQFEKYKLVKEIEIGGNCAGFSIMDDAVNTVVDELFDENTEKYLTLWLTADDGSECEWLIDPEDDETLINAVVSVEIIGWERETK
jgi:hypothetical protein